MCAVIATKVIFSTMMITRGGSPVDLFACIGERPPMRLPLKLLGLQPISLLQERDGLGEFGIV